jgi:hypothetical protein
MKVTGDTRSASNKRLASVKSGGSTQDSLRRL